MMVVAGSAAYLSRTESQYAAGYVSRAKHKAALDGAIQVSINQLLVSSRNNRNLTFTKEYTHQIGDIEVQVQVESESGKIDLNYAPVDLLAAFAEFHGASREEAVRLAAAIADWRDPDNLERLNGAEAAAYQGAGLDYRPANAQFSHPFELQRVLGVTTSLYKKMLPHVTCFSASRGVDLTVASPSMQQFFTGHESVQLETHERILLPDAREYQNSLSKVQPTLLRHISRGRRQVFTLNAKIASENHSRQKTVIVELGGRSSASPQLLSVVE